MNMRLCIVSFLLAAGAVTAQPAPEAKMSEASWKTNERVEERAKQWQEQRHIDEELIHGAINSGDVDVVRHQLALNPYLINKMNDMGEEPLHAAIRERHMDIAEALVELGADVNASTFHMFKGYNEPITPLDYAVWYGNFKIVSLLLDRGANPNHSGMLGITPFHSAIKRGNEDIIRAMVRAGGDFHVKNDWGRATPFDYITEYGRMNVFLRIIAGAVQSGDMKILATLFKAGFSPRLKDRFGDSLLHIAVRVRNVEMVRFLLRQGAHENALNRSGGTPLLEAVRLGDTHIAFVLLKARAYPRAKNARGESPLSLAKESGSREMVRMLQDPRNWKPGLWASAVAFCRGSRPY